MTAGYAHPAYAAAVAGTNEVLTLPRSGGHLVTRHIPGSGLRDAMAPHPFLCCDDWTGLADDLAELPDDIVSVTAVTDPFAELSAELLAASFNRMARPYKAHHVVDLSRPTESFVSRHHREEVRRALRSVAVDRPEPASAFAEWMDLYTHLAGRHAIGGAALIDADTMRRHFAVPGLTVLRATAGAETVGMALWFTDDEVASYHLNASSPAGYALGASYALMDAAMRYFAAAGTRFLGLGAGAGAQGNADDGLSRFKRGWASGQRPTWLCGHVVNDRAYAALAARASWADYFPAYRLGEFL